MNFADFVRKECPSLIPPPLLPHCVTIAEIEAEFSLDPSWEKIKEDTRWLHHLAETIHFQRLRERGEAPPNYTLSGVCKACGPVLLPPWAPPFVEGCPWCLGKGTAIPRPQSPAH